MKYAVTYLLVHVLITRQLYSQPVKLRQFRQRQHDGNLKQLLPLKVPFAKMHSTHANPRTYMQTTEPHWGVPASISQVAIREPISHKLPVCHSPILKILLSRSAQANERNHQQQCTVFQDYYFEHFITRSYYDCSNATK